MLRLPAAAAADDNRPLLMTMMITALIIDVRSAADHITMKLAIVAEDYELMATSITFYDCTVHSSYVTSSASI